MDVNQKIEQIFKDFEVDGIKIPIFFMHYEGKSDIYMTYYSWEQNPYLFADDDYQEEGIFVTIDVWSRSNYKNVVKSIKQKLKENELIWIDNGPDSYESDTKYYHVPINFYIDSSQITNQILK